MLSGSGTLVNEAVHIGIAKHVDSDKRNCGFDQLKERRNSKGESLVFRLNNLRTHVLANGVRDNIGRVMIKWCRAG